MSFVADLELATLLASPTRCIAVAPLGAGARSSSGNASVGVVATLLDVGASHPALIAVTPDWTATLDLSVHGAGWLSEGPIVVDSHLVRAGSRFVVMRADVYDACGLDDVPALPEAIDRGDVGTMAGRCIVTFARLPRRAASDVDDYDPRRWIGEVREHPLEHRLTERVTGRMGIRTIDAGAGVLELDRTSYVANSIGTINGGAQAILIGDAAERMFPGSTAVDLEVRYLAQVREGPARTSCTVLRRGVDHAVVDVQLRDVGADLLLTLATVTLRRSPS